MKQNYAADFAGNERLEIIMKKQIEQTEKSKIAESFTTKQMLISIAGGICILLLAQNATLLLGTFAVSCGIPPAVGNVLAGLLYAFFTWKGACLFLRKIVKQQPEQFYIPKFSISAKWGLLAFAMPLLVLGMAMIAGGHWEIQYENFEMMPELLTGGIFFFGIGGGISEELVFRGVIMGSLEQRFSKKTAVILPSVLFGALHLIGTSMDFFSVIQLLAAGSIVGILFSVIVCKTGSVWNSACVHGIWNAVVIGGILSIGNPPDGNVIFQWIMDSDQALLTGGDFGIEASILSVVTYLIFTWIALKQK